VLVVTPSEAHLLAGTSASPMRHLAPGAGGADRGASGAVAELLSAAAGGMRLRRPCGASCPEGGTVGAAGWKYWTRRGRGPGDGPGPACGAGRPPARAGARGECGRAVHASGLRLRSSVDARRSRGSSSPTPMRRGRAAAPRALREGMTDVEAMEAARLPGLPLSCHPTFATGARAFQGMSSPTGEVLRRGSPRASTSRRRGQQSAVRAGSRKRGGPAGGGAGHAGGLRRPYFEAMSEWCGLMRPGLRGGQVWEHVMNRLAPDLFGITLNPGHLIGWTSGSPRRSSVTLAFRFGRGWPCRWT
jgi:hypothetical protein